MSLVDDIYKRQLWNNPWPTTGSEYQKAHCTPFKLPSAGVIAFDGTTISLTTDVVFRPACTGGPITDVSTIIAGKDPFYASTIPQTYVIAATTVIAWILVLMLIITPRTNFLGQSGSAPGFSSGFGIIGGATGGNTNLIGVGSRPWLQKAAAFTVAISLTIATADTLKCAKKQYEGGYMDATELRDQVLGSLEIRVTRVISDVFLWLAQVQTLIRLFPRHKEKVLIKWIGFALILLDSLFSCLNSFGVRETRTHSPREFADAIPALSYLFELALGLLYAAWVIYYSLTKRKYAFYHAKMPSISLIASLSLVAVLTPVVFFVTDVSNQDVAGWGDYFRWVGAAAASVVVWEWVERIEALERDEKKDGILGREIYDGDEMLDVNPSDEAVWTGSRYDRNRYRRDGSDDSGTQASALEKGINTVARRFRRHAHKQLQPWSLSRAHSQTTNIAQEATESSRMNEHVVFENLPKRQDHSTGLVPSSLTPPAPVASPISRADTISAASTVYIVRHDTTPGPQPVRRRVVGEETTERGATPVETRSVAKDPEKEEMTETDEDVRPNKNRGHGAWLAVTNPFKRKRSSPPAEVQQARRSSTDNAARAATPAQNVSWWDLKNRIGNLVAETDDKSSEKKAGRRPSANLPVTIIPAQPRASVRMPNLAPIESSDAANEAEGRESSSNAQPSSSTARSARNDIARSSPSNSHSSKSEDSEAVNSSSAGARVEPYRNSPPRADEIRPIAGSTSPTIIPAPRRSMKSSPPAITERGPSNSNGIGRDRIE